MPIDRVTPSGAAPETSEPRAFFGRVWRSPVLLPAALFLASVGAALRASIPFTEGRLVYALDDAYIHMAVARNLAGHGVWGCTPYHFASASSSLLWTFGLGVLDRVLHLHDWIPLALNVVLALATLATASRALERFGAPPLLRATALVGIVLSFPLAGMVLIGMEHILHLLLTIAFAAAAVAALTSPAATARVERRRTLALAALAALLAASRYEGFFLIGLVGLAFLVHRQVLRAAAIGVASLVPVAAFGAWSVAQGSYFLPNPLMVKAVGESASTLTALLKPFGSEDLEFLRNDRAMPILLALAVLGALAHWRRGRSLFRAPVLFPLILAGMILLHAHFVFSPLYWAYRYDAYLVGFGLFVAAVVLVELEPPSRLPRGALAALLAALLVPFVTDVREGLVPSAEIEGMRGTYLEQFQTARFIRSYYPDAAVIVNDLGAVTYYTDARILDLVGLGDIEPVRIMRKRAYTSADVVAWTAAYHPRLAVVSLDWAVAAPLVPREWVSVAVVEMPPHRHRVGFFAVDAREAWPLRAAVEQFYEPLAARLGHRVKLRQPEGLDARPSAAAAPPSP